jgi:hypothetical protein
MEMPALPPSLPSTRPPKLTHRYLWEIDMSTINNRQNLPNPTDIAAVRTWVAAHQADLPAVKAWAAPMLNAAHRAGPVPILGETAWRALPDSDPRKIGAALIAALVHVADSTPQAVATRLRAELDAFATAIRRMFAEAENDLRRAKVELGYSTGPSHVELVRRRATHRCWLCGATVLGSIPCPDCGWAGTPEQIRAHATASWATQTSRGSAA